MKVMTSNSIYSVNTREKYVTGGVLGSNKLSYADVRNVKEGLRMEFFDAAGNLIMRTSSVKAIEPASTKH